MEAKLRVLLKALEDARNADRPDTPYIILRELLQLLIEEAKKDG